MENRSARRGEPPGGGYGAQENGEVYLDVLLGKGQEAGGVRIYYCSGDGVRTDDDGMHVYSTPLDLMGRHVTRPRDKTKSEKTASAFSRLFFSFEAVRGAMSSSCSLDSFCFRRYWQLAYASLYFGVFLPGLCLDP